MHVISKKHLREFWEAHPKAETPLLTWYKLVSKTNYEGFSDLHKTFPSADMVDDYIVFNIGGNKYRLIAFIDFNRQKIYIRHVLTHPEYDRGHWKRN
ncbi:MAG: type II toxin-antitoxin system HigB family toxin [Methylomonas sp.]|jgi:mRNA interferase HigB